MKRFFSYGFMNTDTVTVVAQIVHHFLSHTLENAYATHQLHCQ